MKTKKDGVLLLVQKSMLLALAIVLMLTVRFPLLPAAKFLEYDMGDIPVIIASLLFGIPSGIFILAAESLVQSLTVSASSSWEGFVMHVISSGLFLCIVSISYRLGKKSGKEKPTMLLGTVIAALLTAAIMIPLNLILTPMYLGVPVQAVKEMILPVIIPFNLIKWGINGALILMLFAPLKRILLKNHLIEV